MSVNVLKLCLEVYKNNNEIPNSVILFSLFLFSYLLFLYNNFSNLFFDIIVFCSLFILFLSQIFAQSLKFKSLPLQIKEIPINDRFNIKTAVSFTISRNSNLLNSLNIFIFLFSLFCFIYNSFFIALISCFYLYQRVKFNIKLINYLEKIFPELK